MTMISDPLFALLEAPTPLRRLKRIEADLAARPLYVKRDDLMDIGMGGNKLRSLEFWIGAAKAEGADVLLVAGGATSNQCRLTAAAAAVAGLDCIVLHNADDTDENRRASFLNRLFGAEVWFLGKVGEEERAERVREAAQELKRQGRAPYIVGNATIGALGYVAAAAELHRQSQDDGSDIRHVFLPGSMGPTEAGFIFGNALLGNPFEVHLVSVEYGEAELAGRIISIYDALREHTGHEVPDIGSAPVHYHMDQLGPGYGVPTDASEAAILRLARSEGIVLEHVYTAKTFAAFLDLTQTNALPAGEAACIIHTGGTAALFSQFHLFETVA
jgi:1-aminocyclopropane-1-carboxylate deaminase/D-cysteine desulfhydrase-like pyridoxal-dependent ACC family enzyme